MSTKERAEYQEDAAQLAADQSVPQGCPKCPGAAAWGVLSAFGVALVIFLVVGRLVFHLFSK